MNCERDYARKKPWFTEFGGILRFSFILIGNEKLDLLTFPSMIRREADFPGILPLSFIYARFPARKRAFFVN